MFTYRQIQKGDIVLVDHDNKRRIDWPLGQIVQPFPGQNGKIRLVCVQTSKRHLLRFFNVFIC